MDSGNGKTIALKHVATGFKNIIVIDEGKR